MAWGLANLWQEGGEGAYAVCHAVSDFSPRPGEEVDPGRPNFFKKVFPCLFPYGRGCARVTDFIRQNLRAYEIMELLKSEHGE
jgi:hypothetical protein